MSITLDAFTTQRVVPIAWRRAVTGDPDMDAPDIDHRGFAAPYPGSVTGVQEGRTVRVKMLRRRVDLTANLFVTSSDTSILQIVEPADGRVPAEAEPDIHFQGVDGGSDKRDAKIEIRLDSATGPVIGVLFVWVFTPVLVRLAPQMITIAGPSGASPTAPIADLTAIVPLVRAVWIHSGVSFSVTAPRSKTIRLAAPGRVSDNPFPGELSTLLADNWPDGTPNWAPSTINAYFVRQIGTGSTLGYGFSRSSFATFGLPNPGIILGDQTAGGGRTGVMHWANDLAHEIGHFFTLWHPEQLQPPNELEDTWSRQRLMHNFNGMRGHTPWPSSTGNPPQPFQFRPRFNEADYGNLRRGCFVSYKDLPQLTQDDEATRARTTITSSAGPY